MSPNFGNIIDILTEKEDGDNQKERDVCYQFGDFLALQSLQTFKQAHRQRAFKGPLNWPQLSRSKFIGLEKQLALNLQFK